MQEIDELRPAPRRTPTAVLWLMTLAVVGGTAFLVRSLQEQPVRKLASSGIQANGLPARTAAQPPEKETSEASEAYVPSFDSMIGP